MKKCPKCAYERKTTDLMPEVECPNCGVIYSKVLPIKKDKIENSDKSGIVETPKDGAILFIITLLYWTLLFFLDYLDYRNPASRDIEINFFIFLLFILPGIFLLLIPVLDWTIIIPIIIKQAKDRKKNIIILLISLVTFSSIIGFANIYFVIKKNIINNEDILLKPFNENLDYYTKNFPFNEDIINDESKAYIRGDAIVIFRDSYGKRGKDSTPLKNTSKISKEYSIGLLDEEIQPSTVKAVQTAIWISEEAKGEGSYFQGGPAIRYYIRVIIIDLQKGEKILGKEFKGSPPPSSVSRNTRMGIGSLPRKEVAEFLNSLKRIR